MRLGKLPKKYDSRTLQLARYLPKLPPPPPAIDHASRLPADLGLMTNDTLGCHDAATEVLTEHGWVGWPDYDGRALLGTMEPHTGALEFQAPQAVQRYDYDGPLYFTEHASLDFALTPTHRLFVQPYRIPKPYVPGGAGYGPAAFYPVSALPTRVALPATTTGYRGTTLRSLAIGDRVWDGDDLLALIALVISDGWVSGKDYAHAVVSFCCFREDRRKMVAALAHRLDIHEIPGRPGVWKFSDAALAAWIRAQCFVRPEYRSPAKRVPDLVKCADATQITHFLRFFGDQHIQDGARSFYSSSPRLIDDLQELLLRVGRRGTVSVRPPRTSRELHGTGGRIIVSREPAYQLYEDSRAHLGLQRLERRPKQLHTDHYRGEVFCATVPNSTLITRRHGRLLISGNSCTIAAAGHMVQSWSLYAERGMQTIPDADILAAYFAISPNDQGAYLLDALNYWRRTGIGPDKIEAYAEAPIGDLAYLKLCIQYFGSAYIGMSLPDENTFGPWLEPTGPPNPYQGHAVNLCGFNDATQRFKVITWGEVWDMSYKWAQRYIDESYACLNDLSLIQASGQSPEGFDWAALQNDLAHIGEVEIRAKFPGQEVQITQFREIEKLKAALAPRAKSRTPWTRLRATPSPERSATSSPGRFDEPSNPGRPP